VFSANTGDVSSFFDAWGGRRVKLKKNIGLHAGRCLIGPDLPDPTMLGMINFLYINFDFLKNIMH
jgi:hypothetical protein